jgi:hypothetical protein
MELFNPIAARSDSHHWVKHAVHEMDVHHTHGKFREYCGGKVTQECINEGKHSRSSHVRHMAQLAENFRHMHHH